PIDGSANVVSVLIGNGDSKFQAPVTNTLGSATGSSAAAYSMVVGDFNVDGNVDIAVSTQGVPLYVFAGKGDGTFQPAVQAQALDPDTFISGVADLNGDGIPDLVGADEVAPGLT